MSMRISDTGRLGLLGQLGLFALLPGGCGQSQEQRQAALTAQFGPPILCRTAGDSVLRPACFIERGADMALLTIRHPDGGFRRLRIVADGHGIVAADGAEKAQVTILSDKRIDVTVGGDVYQFPATIIVANDGR